MKTNLQHRLFLAAAEVFKPLPFLAVDEVALIEFFERIGWDIQALLGNDVSSLSAILAGIGQSASTFKALTTSGSVASFAESRQALVALKNLGNALEQFKALPIPAATAEALAADVLSKLFTFYLHQHPVLYSALVLAGVVVADKSVITQGTTPIKFYSEVPVFKLDNLLALVRDPAQALKSEYWPNGSADFATIVETNQVADRLFSRLAILFEQLGMEAYLSHSQTVTPLSAEDAQVLNGLLYATRRLALPSGGHVELGLGAGLLPVDQGGPGAYFFPFGVGDYEIKLADWLLRLQASLAGAAIVVKESGVEVLGDNAIPNVSISLELLSASDVYYNFGNQDGTHLEIGKASIGAQFQTDATTRSYSVHVAFTDSSFTIAPGDGDSFLSKIIPAQGLKTKFNALLGWSSTKGFYFGGTVGFRNTTTITSAQSDRLLRITAFDTALSIEDKLAISLGISGEVKLGPVKAIVKDIGVTTSLRSATGRGNLGPFDFDLGFKAPTGVGIEVKSDFVNGGGYLYFDAPNHKYAGVANLQIKAGPKEINVNAIGLLQTQLPGHPDAYSLLLLLTATFGPIELGLGFKLSGLGGLVGVNRAANTDYLRTLVRTQKLDTLLFPADVMRDPAGAVALADSAFPARVGRHTIGLMAQLGWGVSGNLITLDVALLVEFPEPLTIIMLGVLQASLPSKANELLKLRADFLGYVDFGAKKAAFDATLSESKLLVYSLSGDMAFRLFQGDNPVFVITAGGFHPSFQPPAGAALTGLKRITLALAPSNDLRVTLASYYAVTSNTVQFGANLDLYYRLCRGLHVDGHFGFDVLFQFNPFYLTAHVAAGVAIKNGNSELLSLHLSLDVTGPRPWHIWGEASFRIWFVKIKVGVNATINSGGGSEPALTAPDVHAMLVQALAAPTSWEVEAPKTAAQPGGVVLRPVAATAGQPFLDPRGALVLRQHVTPLGLLLNKYGSGTSAPVHGRYFTLTELTLGTGTSGHTYKLSDNDGLLEPVREFFAPDQFTALTDAQRLSVPSFQLLANGLRLKGLAGLTSTTQVTRRVVAYEQKLLDGTSGGHRLKVEAEQFRQLAKGGVLGQAVAAARPSARAPRPVGWAEDSYAVANAADLTAYAGHASFPTQVEAEQFRQAVVAAKPSLAAEVLVVPSYELAEA